MKKRFFTTLLAISALGLTLTSCGETTNDPENVQLYAQIVTNGSLTYKPMTLSGNNISCPKQVFIVNGCRCELSGDLLSSPSGTGNFKLVLRVTRDDDVYTYQVISLSATSAINTTNIESTNGSCDLVLATYTLTSGNLSNLTLSYSQSVVKGDGTGGGTTSTITIDDVLSTSSTNPVQNKVITAELNKKSTVIANPSVPESASSLQSITIDGVSYKIVGQTSESEDISGGLYRHRISEVSVVTATTRKALIVYSTSATSVNSDSLLTSLLSNAISIHLEERPNISATGSNYPTKDIIAISYDSSSKRLSCVVATSASTTSLSVTTLSINFIMGSSDDVTPLLNGSGGTNVVANPSDNATDTLDTIQIGGIVYNLPIGGSGIANIDSSVTQTSTNPVTSQGIYNFANPIKTDVAYLTSTVDTLSSNYDTLNTSVETMSTRLDSVYEWYIGVNNDWFTVNLYNNVSYMVPLISAGNTPSDKRRLNFAKINGQFIAKASNAVENYNIEVQEPLVSGQNIKSVNGVSLLGAGNLTIEEGDTITSVSATQSNIDISYTTQTIGGTTKIRYATFTGNFQNGEMASAIRNKSIVGAFAYITFYQESSGSYLPGSQTFVYPISQLVIDNSNTSISVNAIVVDIEIGTAFINYARADMTLLVRYS